MRLTSKSQAGIAAVEILLVVALVLAVGAVVVKVRSAKTASKLTPVATQKSTASDIKEVKTDSDLQALDSQAGKDNLDVPTPDESKLDSELSSF